MAQPGRRICIVDNEKHLDSDRDLFYDEITRLICRRLNREETAGLITAIVYKREFGGFLNLRLYWVVRSSMVQVAQPGGCFQWVSGEGNAAHEWIEVNVIKGKWND